MPREQINYPRWRGDLPEVQRVIGEGGEYEDQPNPTPSREGPQFLSNPVLHVNWSGVEAGGHVQISVEMDSATLRQILGPTPDSVGPTVTMYTEVLSRGEINRLVTVLRRARDKAYGRDA